VQEKGWKPRWFAKEKDSNSYRYVGGYWETREKGNWESYPDIFGQVSILILTQLHKFSTLLPTYSPYYNTLFDHSIYS